jgi:hypothetical protein
MIHTKGMENLITETFGETKPTYPLRLVKDVVEVVVFSVR